MGMRAQSLYAYFPSKHAIYDAMFAAGNRELLDRVTTATRPASDPVDRLRRHAGAFLDFCAEDPVRFRLLFQRTIPGFVPTAQSYAPAVAVLTRPDRRCGRVASPTRGPLTRGRR